MSEGHILVVEDDRLLVQMLEEGLQREGYTVESLTSGTGAVEAGARPDVALIVLDLTLPGKDGFEICRELREKRVATPVLMLTGRDELQDRVQGLKLGADDYLVKPFEMEELCARIEALLRRARPGGPLTSFHCDGLRVDFRQAIVQRDGDPIELSAIELKLLQYFIDHRGEALSRQELLEKVWGYTSTLVTRTVDVHIGSLRQKIERDPSRPEHIVTMHGIGYKFLPR